MASLAAGVAELPQSGTCVFVEVSLIKPLDQSGFLAGFTMSLNCPVSVGVTTEVSLALVG